MQQLAHRYEVDRKYQLDLTRVGQHRIGVEAILEAAVVVARAVVGQGIQHKQTDQEPPQSLHSNLEQSIHYLSMSTYSLSHTINPQNVVYLQHGRDVG